MARVHGLIHREAQRIHFQRRAVERLGVALNRDEIQQIVTFIQSGDAQLIDGEPGFTRWGVSIRGVDCVVVFDEKTKQLVTVLHREWLEEKPKQREKAHAYWHHGKKHFKR